MRLPLGHALLDPESWEHVLAVCGAAALVAMAGLSVLPQLRGAVAGRLAPAAAPVGAQAVTAAHVIDGDTFVIDSGQSVRLLGVDTPETVNPNMDHAQPYGREAADRLRMLIEGRTVVLERDTTDADHYGRLLRHVWLGRALVAEVLAAEGLGRAGAIAPDTRYAARIAAAEARAREARAGLWSLPRPTPIEAFRPVPTGR